MHNIIRTAFDRGVTFFDAAEAYGPHEVERILGEGVAPFRNKVVITSKFGWNIDLETGKRLPGLNSRPEHIKQAVEGMLQAPAHRPHRPAVPAPGRPASADRGRGRRRAGPHEAGQGAALGPVRNGTEDPAPRACRLAGQRCAERILDAVARAGGRGVIAACQELGIGFVPWSPLGVGFLAGAIDANTRFADGDIRKVESRFRTGKPAAQPGAGDTAQGLGRAQAGTPAQIALAWLMAQKPWIVPIPGTTQMAHMLENIGAANVRFAPAEMAELNRSVAAIQVRGARLPDAVQVFSGVEAPAKS
jgi:aryl-alcohol dehydrogenase-like predicted oxidoreductase